MLVSNDDFKVVNSGKFKLEIDEVVCIANSFCGVDLIVEISARESVAGAAVDIWKEDGS